MGQVVSLRRQLQRSVDLLDLGAIIRDAGAVMLSAGTHVMQMHELPTEHMLREIDAAGRAMCGMAAALRVAMSPVVVDLPPCDVERGE